MTSGDPLLSFILQFHQYNEWFGLNKHISPHWDSFFKKNISCVWVFWLPVYVHAGCPWRPEGGLRSPGTSYRWLPAAMWVLGIEPQSSGKAASALNL